MKPLRDIWLDLVDRKLWPLAALLVIALVAVPVLLSRSASGGAGGSDVAAALPTAATPVVSTSQTSTSGGVYVGGGARDPFAQQHVPKPTDLSGPTASGLGPATAAIGSSGAGAGSSVTGAASSSSSSSTGSTGSADVTITRHPAHRGGHSHKTAPRQQTELALVRLGRAGQAKRSYKLAPLAAFPTRRSPVLVFLGFRDGGKRAAFLVPSSTSPQGEGSCKPVRRVCSTLYLRNGQTEFLDVGSGVHTVQYELHYLRASK